LKHAASIMCALSRYLGRGVDVWILVCEGENRGVRARRFSFFPGRSSPFDFVLVIHVSISRVLLN
jgi:hypothetical protein